MPSQDPGRTYARAERRKASRPAEPAAPPPSSDKTAKGQPEEGDRGASRRARGVVVRARRHSDERLRPNVPSVNGFGGSGGPFAGRGPKGYKRDDRRIREDVCDTLLGDSEVDASEIVVSVTEGEVTFDGTVSDRATKHYVECIGAACLGVTGVQNNLRTPGMYRGRTATREGPSTVGSLRLEFDRISGD